MSEPGLRVLVVDDEALARSRLRTLLGDCQSPGAAVIAEAAEAVAAMAILSRSTFDLVLLDIHMPGMDGMALARQLRALPDAPALVFVTAHAEHALQAFELEAIDYLTKPVRLERLQQSLQKVQRTMQYRRASGPDLTANSLLIQDRGRTERVPLAEVLYFKAELKYLTVRTALRTHLLEAALNDLEARHSDSFLRIHRNALVARHAMRALERVHGSESGDDAESWVLRLNGVEERLAVSRRQIAAVRAVLSA